MTEIVCVWSVFLRDVSERNDVSLQMLVNVVLSKTPYPLSAHDALLLHSEQQPRNIQTCEPRGTSELALGNRIVPDMVLGTTPKWREVVPR